METIEGFVKFVLFIIFRTREQAQSQVCKHAERTINVINGHYMLASPPTKQMVSNKCHKRKCQVNQSHASGSDNFNGAEEVVYKGEGWRILQLFSTINGKQLTHYAASLSVRQHHHHHLGDRVKDLSVLDNTSTKNTTTVSIPLLRLRNARALYNYMYAA